MGEEQLNYQFLQVNVGGVPYRWEIDPSQYSERDIVDFAPRAGGGDVAYSNLDLYQIYTQDSWHHGFGFIQARDKFGYRITDGDLDTRHIGMVMQATAYGVDYAGSTIEQIRRVVDFGGSTYVAATSGIWKRTSSGTWTRVVATNTSDLISNGEYLVASFFSGRMQVSSNGTTWTNAGPTGNPPNNFYKLALHNGFMWGVESSTATRNLTGTNATVGTFAAGDTATLAGSGTHAMSELAIDDFVSIGTGAAKVKQIYSDTSYSVQFTLGVTLAGGETIVRHPSNTYHALHFWASADCSDAEGGGLADVSAIILGTSGVVNMASFNGSLYIGKSMGIWVVDETVSPPVVRRVVDFSDEDSSDNCSVFIPWKGRLYFNIGNTLYAYTGSSMVNVTTPEYSLNFPPSAFGRFKAATYRGSYLYVLARDNESALLQVNSYSLLAFDGTGWHRVGKLPPYADHGRFLGMGYSAVANGIIMGDGEALIVRFNASDELPYPYFNVEIGRNYIDLSEIDAGFRRVPKSFAEVDLETDNPAGTSVIAYYYDSGQISGNAPGWTRLGSVASSGVSALTFDPTFEDYKLLLRLYFQTTDSAKSAILRNLAVKYMLRPNVLYGHKLVLNGADFVRMLDGRILPASSAVQRAWLRAARASRAPVQFVTPFGESKKGYISTLMFTNLQRRPEEKRSNWSAVLNIVEVG